MKARRERGQPVLIGTASIEKNEILSAFLSEAGVPHEVLNAKNHEREGGIIAQAGRKGAVTVATNMAGRGVDIILGGNPPEPKESEEVRAAGGLHVLATERHESRRIDNQLRGRAGRQGDPGSTQFFISTEDDLMRIFGGDRVKGIMERLHVPDDMPIEHGLLSKSVEQAQKRVEGHNFDIRKHLIEYDDVINKHRTVIYGKRRKILKATMERTEEGERPLKRIVLDAIEQEVEQAVMIRTGEEDASAWDVAGLEQEMTTILPVGMDVKGKIESAGGDVEGKLDHAERRTKLIETIMGLVKTAFDAFERYVGEPAILTDVERVVCLRAMDDAWITHLENIGHLRHGIGLQGYGQRDPLVEYKKEAYRMFGELQAEINRQIAKTIFHIQVTRQQEADVRLSGDTLKESGPAKDAMEEGAKRSDVGATSHVAPGDKVGRNDPCPCGSGKKYKKCCGVNA